MDMFSFNNQLLKYIEKVHELYLPQRLLNFAVSLERHSIYQKAISKVILSQNNVITLHVGIGSIISAILSVASGAKMAIICEPSKYLTLICKTIIDENNLSDKISVYQKSIRDLKHKDAFEQIPNLLILDCIDSSLLGQGIISIIQYVQNDLLLSDIEIIPKKAILYAVPLELRTNDICGFDLTKFNRYRWNIGFEEIDLFNESCKRLSEPFKCLEFDFQKPLIKDNLSLKIKIKESGILNAIAYWFDIYLDDQILLSSNPKNSKLIGWKQALQYFEEEFPVKSGDELLISASHDLYRIHFKINERTTKHGKFNNLRHSVPHWHFPMISDNERNMKYQEAITRAIRKSENANVLDIGTGTGLLAMIATRAGAKSVTACEMIRHIAQTAHDIITDNGFGSQINLLPKLSHYIKIPDDMPENSNILVSETVDHSLLGEQFLDTLRHAREELLSENPVIIPLKATVYAQAIELRIKDICGFNFETLNLLRLNHYTSFHLQDAEYQGLTGIFKTFEFNFYDKNFHPDNKYFEVPVIQGGICNAIAFWFDLHLDEDIVISTAPNSKITAWQQAVIFFDEEIQVEKGMILPFIGQYDLHQLNFGINKLDCMLRGIQFNKKIFPKWYQELLIEEMEIHSYTRDINELLQKLPKDQLVDILNYLIDNVHISGFDPIIVSDFIIQLGYN